MIKRVFKGNLDFYMLVKSFQYLLGQEFLLLNNLTHLFKHIFPYSVRLLCTSACGQKSYHQKLIVSKLVYVVNNSYEWLGGSQSQIDPIWRSAPEATAPCFKEAVASHKVIASYIHISQALIMPSWHKLAVLKICHLSVPNTFKDSLLLKGGNCIA